MQYMLMLLYFYIFYNCSFDFFFDIRKDLEVTELPPCLYCLAVILFHHRVAHSYALELPAIF